MIIVNLKGGLGNQMFQYATGRALAIKNKDILKIDDSSLSFAKEIGYIHRAFSLQYFNIGAGVVDQKDVIKIKYPKGLISKIISKINTKILKKYFVNYDKTVMEQTGDIFLDGYYQSEKYFKDYEKEIRESLTLKEGLKGELKSYLEKIKNDPYSVSVHVRRGDYVKHPEFGGICSINYYKDAEELILKSIPEANFYIFSDDVNWVRKNIFFGRHVNFLHKHYSKDFEELVMMSYCKHNIISNSSFGWWGAWLNTNKDKIIIAPKEWAKKGKERFKDIVPESWIRI